MRDRHGEPFGQKYENSSYRILTRIDSANVMVRVKTDDMMAAIRAKAKRDKTSVAEAIRTLLTWGLEAENGF